MATRSGTGVLRAANTRSVLATVTGYSGEPVTHAELARETGLAAGTISSIVHELADAGILDTVAGSGRRGATVRLARSAGLVAGVDFGHSHLSVAIADMSGMVIGEVRTGVSAEQDHRDALAQAARMLESLFSGHEDQRKLLRTIGFGLPAPIAHGKVLGSAIQPGWLGINVRQAASEFFRVPVVVDNDANLGAIAEHRLGAGRGHSELVFVKISSGVGAGLIVDGRLFRGAEGIAGEIGHLTIDEQGPLCRCGGRGCLEAYTATGTALDMIAGHLEGATLDDIIEAARQGNVAARRVFEDVGLHLGWGLASVTNLLNPGVIVVGGDMARAGDLLLDSTRLGLRRHVLAGADTVPIVASELGDRASLLGAIQFAVDSTDLLVG